MEEDAVQVTPTVLYVSKTGHHVAPFATEADAAALIGASNTVFRTLEAVEYSSAGYYAAAGHYQEQRELGWRFGLRVFLTWTGYNSTMCGGARDPETVAGPLFDEAMARDLMPGLSLVTPAPMTPCPAELDVDPLTCAVQSEMGMVTGTTGLGCRVTVTGGIAPVTVESLGTTFAVLVGLEESRGHRLTVTAVCDTCTVQRTRDRTGAELLVYRVPAPTPTQTP